MANTKSIIREINLQNTSINLNKNKSIISDFAGFNKNTGVWFNGVLSNLYCIDDKADDDVVINIDKDTYKIVDDALYKNDVLVKDYSNSNKLKTEILGNIEDNVIAYTPLVHIYYEGNNAYVKYDDVIVPVGTYKINAIPYIIIDKEADTWCVLYGRYAVCKGMTVATSFSFVPTAAIYSANSSKWFCINTSNWSLINVQNTTDTVLLDNTTAPIIDGAVTVSGWTPKYRAVQLNSRTVFAAIDDLSVSDTPSVTINKSEKTFMYLKGFWIEDNYFAGLYARPHYSQDGDAIDMSVIPDKFTLYSQAYNAWNKLASIKTKFLSYNSYLTMPYGTSATKSTAAHGAFSSVDGPTAYLLESCYTKDDADFVTLSGSTAAKPKPASISKLPATIGEANYPKLLGLVNKNLSPEWLYTDVFDFKLIYNKDALVGISKNNSIVVPWNDVDENTLTITENDIYYYSLNSNAWVHVNISTENELKAIKIGNNLLLNSLKDNCCNKSLSTFNVDTTLANFKTFKPRVGLINMYGILVDSFVVRGSTTNYNLGNGWLTYMLEAIKNGDIYYISIVSENNGPIWAAAHLLNYKDTNVRKEGWQWTLDVEGNAPSIDNKTIDYAYILNAMVLNGRPNIDAYTYSGSVTERSVLSYFKSWFNGIARYNNKLADTEKSLTEPTYYNLSPNLDIMTFIDGFNTIALIKVGNNTVQLLVKESELMLVYNILSSVSNISDYFVLQGQQYGIINNYINKIDTVNGQVVAQTPITSVEGLKFLGNTDKQAFFFSQMNKTILYFAADNTLEFLMDATELDNNTTTVFAKQTNDIFLLLNDKVVVFTNSGSMYEMLSRAEYITFGDNSWSDGNKTWSYYKINPEQERVPIELETLWYGDTTNRKMMNVDCVYIELYDDNFMPGTFEISFDNLVNNTVSTKKQVINIKEKDYDRVTKTYYLRYQPALQNCSAFKLNIKSDIAIKRLAIGYTSEGISTISKNNI